MGKILVKYKKLDRMKFISHLELIRVIERAFRRAEIPLKFSQGFNPHPKLAFAAPLSVGVSSDGEYLDVELKEEIKIEDFLDRANKHLPEGITFINCRYIDEKSDSLMSLVSYGSYIIKAKASKHYKKQEVEKIIEKFLAMNEILFEKRSNKTNKTKTIDIRSMIKDMFLLSFNEKDIILKVVLATGSRGNLKPEILIDKLIEVENLDIDKESTRIHRLELFTIDNKNEIIPIENNEFNIL